MLNICGYGPNGVFSGTISSTISSTAIWVAFRYRCKTTDPLLKVEWFINTRTGTPGNLGVVIAADVDGVPSVSGGVPVDIGGGSPTLATVACGALTSNTRQTTTFTNGYTPTAGEYVWIVFYATTGTWDASNKLMVQYTHANVGASYGDENVATTADTGATWTRANKIHYVFSLLTTADAYLTTDVSCCTSILTQTAYDDTSNPDERGVGWTIPANLTVGVYGLTGPLRLATSTSTFDIRCYLGDSQQSSRSVDPLDLMATAGLGVNNLLGTLAFASAPINLTAGTGRVTLKATHATDDIYICTYDCGSQARRESCLLLRDYWYCSQNAGGGFTDDKTISPLVYPIIDSVSAGGGGGGLLVHPGLSGGM